MCFATDPMPKKAAKAPSVERRKRRAVSMHGHIERDDGRFENVVLLDLSHDGCGVETAAELQAGEQVKLSVLDRGAIEAEVRWCEDGKAGLTFLSQPAGKKEYWPRRSTRIDFSAEVSMRRIGHHNFRVRVFDASPHGCKVELVEVPKVGDYLVLRFAGLEALEAEVCWMEGFTAGLRFAKPMHPAVFDLMVARVKAGH